MTDEFVSFLTQDHMLHLNKKRMNQKSIAMENYQVELGIKLKTGQLYDTQISHTGEYEYSWLLFFGTHQWSVCHNDCDNHVNADPTVLIFSDDPYH